MLITLCMIGFIEKIIVEKLLITINRTIYSLIKIILMLQLFWDRYDSG